VTTYNFLHGLPCSAKLGADLWGRAKFVIPLRMLIFYVAANLLANL